MVTPAEYQRYCAEVADEKRRLREGLKRQGITMARFASLCGCSPSNVSAYLSPLHDTWRLPRYIWRVAVDKDLV